MRFGGAGSRLEWNFDLNLSVNYNINYILVIWINFKKQQPIHYYNISW